MKSYSIANKNNKYMGIKEKIRLEIDMLLSKPDTCKCGSEFEYAGLGMYKCRMCTEKFKNEYAIIRDFVDTYGTSYSVYEISDITNVPRRLIDLFIRDGRFTVVTKQPRCRECNILIERGLYCRRCALIQTGNTSTVKKQKKIRGIARPVDNMQGEMHFFIGEEEK